MLRKLEIYLKNQNKILFVFLILFSKITLAVNGDIPVDNTYLRLPDGREIFSVRKGDHSHQIVLKDKQKILWQKTFEYEYDRLWDYAFFVPIKKKDTSATT